MYFVSTFEVNRRESETKSTELNSRANFFLSYGLILFFSVFEP